MRRPIESALPFAVGVQDARGDLLVFELALGHSTVEGVDGQLGGHTVRDGVADYSSGLDDLDCAAMKLALLGGVLGDVAEPEPVRDISGEIPLHVVVEDRRSGLLSLAAATTLRSCGNP